MAEKYFLMPGVTISKEGLPGKKLECKKGGKPVKIDDKHVDIIKKNLPFLISQKKVVTASELDAIVEAKEKEAEEKKSAEAANKKAVSDKMKALIEHAESVGLEVPEGISQKELKVLIQDKIAENKVFDDLKKQAEELELEVPEGISVEDLDVLIKEELEK